jgi:NAD(P)-dependent dehydrogenase (short-subunit alcohol dehydrogenase family)
MLDVVDRVGGFPVPADVSDRDQVFAAVEQIERAHGPISVLVCNAAYMTMGSLTEHDEDDWWRVVDTNLTGTFQLIQAVLPGMRRLGGGHIVIIASEWGVTGWPRASAYSASKAGLISLTKTLGRELAPEGIYVNAIAPGVTDTPQLEVDASDAGLTLEQMHGEYAKDIPLGRIGQPQEIAAGVSLLTRQDMGAVVGQVLQINGGTTRCRV